MPTKPRMQQQEQRVPGIPCPHCGNFIPTSIQQILFSNCLFCPTCGLKLNIDKRKSDKALKILAKVDEAQRRLEDTSHFGSGSVLESENNISDDIEKALEEIVLIEEDE